MSIRKETTKDPLNSQISKTDDTKTLNSERVNSSVWLERKTLRVALISTFTALSVVLGYLLAYIPNLEIFTLMIFLSGFVLNKRYGALIGLLSSIIFTFFNPLGPSPPPLFIYQLIHYSLTGISGGLTKDFMQNRKFFKPKEDLYVYQVMVIFGVVGGILTFLFDIFSTLFGGFIVSITIDYFIATYLFGLVFTTVHLIGNILVFVFLLPGLIQLIMKLLD
ncbi:MAG TPA: hypothetical protein VMV43_13330 [Candidatus Nanopelagicaceae bacterium]|jgi:hypothetical protein|nr:hypothetical protein [Candidatus Nanopelagicaceae bacterium]